MMARARSPDSIEAEKMYRSGMKLVEIAQKLGVPDGTVRRWKSTQKWEITVKGKSERSEKKKTNVRKLGAPIGNRNAQGAGAPKRNRNAEKHGAFSKVYWDSLDDTESQLLKQIDYDEEYQLERQIDLYTIRERRLLLRINDYKKEGERMSGMLVKKITKEKGAGKDNSKTEFEAVMNSIITLESELTKIQRAKTNAINSLILLRNKNRQWEESLRENELINDYIDSITQTGEEETEDDGFLKSLNEQAAAIWEETENE